MKRSNFLCLSYETHFNNSKSVRVAAGSDGMVVGKACYIWQIKRRVGIFMRLER